MSGDYVERLEAAYATRRAKVAGTRPDVVEVLSADLRAALDDLERLRAGQRPALGNAYAAGWTDAVAGFRTPGWAEREAGWKRFLAGPDAEDVPQQPERRVVRCGRECSEAYTYVLGWCEQAVPPEFRIDAEAETQPTPMTEAPQQPELPKRQAQLLAAIQRWGGEWSPMRACRLLDTRGYVVTRERAHQIMKHLAERGYLEQVRPRAYTYRLKAEVPQQPNLNALCVRDAMADAAMQQQPEDGEHG